jgi:hypothetical protein
LLIATNASAERTIWARALEQRRQRFAVGLDPLEQRLELRLVRFGHRCQRIECRQHLLRLSVVQIHYQHRYLGVGRGLGPQMPIDNLQAAVWQFAHHQCIDVTHFGQDAAEVVLLFLGVFSPIFGVRAQVAGTDSTELFDSIPDIHVGNP